MEKGSHHTIDAKRKIGMASKGRVKSEREKARLRASWTPERRKRQAQFSRRVFTVELLSEKAQKQWKSGNCGPDWTPELRAIVAKKKRMWWTPERRSAISKQMRKQRMAQRLPTKDTSLERTLAQGFDNLGLLYEQNASLFGKFQPDFIFVDAGVIVQADGEYWHNLPGRQKSDRAFDKMARQQDWKVLRFPGKRIMEDLESCLQEVQEALS